MRSISRNSRMNGRLEVSNKIDLRGGTPLQELRAATVISCFGALSGSI